MRWAVLLVAASVLVGWSLLVAGPAREMLQQRLETWRRRGEEPGTASAFPPVESGGVSGTPVESFFIESRLDRDRARGQQVELLREVMNNPASGDEVKTEAGKSLLRMAEAAKAEAELESLIKAKGFGDALVYVCQEAVIVIVKAESLTPVEASRIADLVLRTTGTRLENVLIVPRN